MTLDEAYQRILQDAADMPANCEALGMHADLDLLFKPPGGRFIIDQGNRTGDLLWENYVKFRKPEVEATRDLVALIPAELRGKLQFTDQTIAANGGYQVFPYGPDDRWAMLSQSLLTAIKNPSKPFARSGSNPPQITFESLDYLCGANPQQLQYPRLLATLIAQIGNQLRGYVPIFKKEYYDRIKASRIFTDDQLNQMRDAYTQITLSALGAQLGATLNAAAAPFQKLAQFSQEFLTVVNIAFQGTAALAVTSAAGIGLAAVGAGAAVTSAGTALAQQGTQAAFGNEASLTPVVGALTPAALGEVSNAVGSAASDTIGEENVSLISDGINRIQQSFSVAPGSAFSDVEKAINAAISPYVTVAPATAPAPSSGTSSPSAVAAAQAAAVKAAVPLGGLLLAGLAGALIYKLIK